MNPRVTLGLLAVLLALGGYVYFGGGPASTTSGSAGASKPGGPAGAASKDKPADPQLAVFQFDERAAQRLTVRNAAGQQVTLENSGDGTWVLQPSGEPADRLRISGLLLRLSTLRATRRIAEPANLAEFGLALPAAVATIAVAGSPELTLTLGGRAPAESGTYAQKGSDPALYVISNAVAQDLERLVNEPPRQTTPTAPASPSPVGATTP